MKVIIAGAAGRMGRELLKYAHQNADIDIIGASEESSSDWVGKDIGEVIVLSLNNDDDVWYGIAKIKLSQLYLFEKNNKLECEFYSSNININFPSYMLPLPKKI